VGPADPAPIDGAAGLNSHSSASSQAVIVPAPIAQDLVKALADLLLASAGDADHDEERNDAREDHR
jgi:hypothetical protein